MANGRISRREFLKMIGLGGFLSFSGLASLGLFSKQNLTSQIFAQTTGSWSLGPNTTDVAIHAALLPDGRVLYLAGSYGLSTHLNGPFNAYLLDPNSGSETVVSVSEDIFCAGQVQLPNGNILFAGGTLKYDTAPDNCNGLFHGLKSAFEFDISSGTFVKVSSMMHGRWYPTLITLYDGRVMNFSGWDEYGTLNKLLEIYDPSLKLWTINYDPSSNRIYCVGAGYGNLCEGAGSPCYGGSNMGVAPNTQIYPRAHLMPSGTVFVSGPGRFMKIWNPVTGVWSNGGTNSTYRDYGTSILLPLNNTKDERGKILLVGGSPEFYTGATNKVEIVDFEAGSPTDPVIRPVASIAYARKFLLPVVLPNGKIIIFGGSANGNSIPVYVPEVFDPVSETWTSLPAASVPRVYHSVALLLPDGRVWTAGGTPSSIEGELRTEFYRPEYYFERRPIISGTPFTGGYGPLTAPALDGYGGTITIPTPDASEITAVSLVRLANSTHHYDTDSRLIWLRIIRKNSDSLVVSGPINPMLAPPGYYMIHLLRSDIPSVGKIIRIPLSVTTVID